MRRHSVAARRRLCSWWYAYIDGNDFPLIVGMTGFPAITWGSRWRLTRGPPLMSADDDLAQATLAPASTYINRARERGPTLVDAARRCCRLRLFYMLPSYHLMCLIPDQIRHESSPG